MNTKSEEKEMKSIYDSEQLIKWGGLLNEFLWICAGVNRKVLRQCPTDYAKYAGVGGTILFTAVLAALSGGYAIYKVFADEQFNTTTKLYETDINAVYIAIFFGIIWGFMIFNLDRFMVNTMYSDGTHKITKDERKGAAPRLVLAFFLGVVISTPIELRIFKDKIQAQLIIAQGEERKKMDEQHQDLDVQIKEKEEKQSQNRKRLDRKRDELAKAEESLYNETIGRKGTGKFGYGPAAKQLQSNVDRLRREVEKLDQETKEANEAIEKDIEVLKKERNNYALDAAKAEKSMKGFAAELKALNTITSPFDDIELFLARGLIMFLFIAIEIIPTLFKLMMIDGPYDAIIKAEKHHIQALSDKRISDLNDEIDVEIKISTEKNEERIKAEVLANKELMEKLAKAQAELLETAIEEWRKQELEKINENPGAYIMLAPKEEKA